MFTRRTALTAVLCLINSAAFAAVNNNAASYGQWKNSDGHRLSVGADGVKQYADSEEPCQRMGYKMSGEHFRGDALRADMQAMLEYHQTLLPSLSDADSRAMLQDNIRSIKRLLPLIHAKKNYNGIAMYCGDNSLALIFINQHNALESNFSGGETFYQHYRK